MKKIKLNIFLTEQNMLEIPSLTSMISDSVTAYATSEYTLFRRYRGIIKSVIGKTTIIVQKNNIFLIPCIFTMSTENATLENDDQH